jgi:hypothetical protein
MVVLKNFCTFQIICVLNSLSFNIFHSGVRKRYQFRQRLHPHTVRLLFHTEICLCCTNSGCATKSECTNPMTGKSYNGQHVTVNGSRPAGMRVSVDCCKAKKFVDDDAVAIDMSNVCNSASQLSILPGIVAGIVFTLVAAFN